MVETIEMDEKQIEDFNKVLEDSLYFYKATMLRAIDGDTFELSIDVGFNIHLTETIRLLGVDTPEIHGVKKNTKEYKEGIRSKEFVESILTGKTFFVETHKDKKEKYGRWLANILVDGKDLARMLLDSGLAKEYKI